jgi:predicted RNA-binding Zn-ribbon protein involved in translation (DUF1610 family)
MIWPFTHWNEMMASTPPEPPKPVPHDTNKIVKTLVCPECGSTEVQRYSRCFTRINTFVMAPKCDCDKCGASFYHLPQVYQDSAHLPPLCVGTFSLNSANETIASLNKSEGRSQLARHL